MCSPHPVTDFQFLKGSRGVPRSYPGDRLIAVGHNNFIRFSTAKEHVGETKNEGNDNVLTMFSPGGEYENDFLLRATYSENEDRLSPTKDATLTFSLLQWHFGFAKRQ